MKVSANYKGVLEFIRCKIIICVLFFTVTHLFAKTCETDPIRLAFKHLESKGIGFNKGYSTLEVFFASTEAWGTHWLPFLDVRGHLFNNGRSAINSGIGVRYIASRIWGVNGYYDYRRTNRGHYNQVALGLESIGKRWDVRLNLYHPFGKKVHYFDAKKEFALDSYNGEIGFHVDSFEKAPLYFAAGPYYLNGFGKEAWGGEMRGNVEMYQHVRLQVSSSYDHLYQWVVQGQLTFFFQFGGKKEKEGKCHPSRSFQQVDRGEIIPTLSKKTH